MLWDIIRAQIARLLGVTDGLIFIGTISYYKCSQLIRLPFAYHCHSNEYSVTVIDVTASLLTGLGSNRVHACVHVPTVIIITLSDCGNKVHVLVND